MPSVNTLPSGWEPEELEAFKNEFREQRPQVRYVVVRGLWRYWISRCPDQRLFDGDEDNVALVLHARAYGESVPDAADRGLMGMLLRENQSMFSRLGQKPLPWGPRAALAVEVEAALSSPVVNVWIFKREGLIHQVLVIGEGIPGIREQIRDAAFMASITLQGAQATDLVNIGVISVASADEPLDLPFPMVELLGEQPVSPEPPETAEAKLAEFVSLLASLQRRTGLVRLHHADWDEQRRLLSELRSLPERVEPQVALVWAPGSLSGTVSERPLTDIASLTSYLRIPEGYALTLDLSSDLLTTELYQRLEAEYRTATIERIKADVASRLEHYRREIQHLELEKEEFDAASEQERVARWDSTVTLSVRFENKTGRTIQLPAPEDMSRKEYFAVNVPVLIDNYRAWHARMERILRDIRSAVDRPDAPIRRLLATRVLDAVVRDTAVDEGEPVKNAFRSWCESVQPMLWFEWRCALRGLDIEPSDVFTPHTLFQTLFRRGDAGSDFGPLLMRPLSVVHQSYSAVLVDPDRHAFVIQDPTDHAQPVSRHSEDTERLWENLRSLAFSQESTSQEEFNQALLSALRSDPRGVIGRMLDVLTAPPEHDEEEDDDVPATRQGVQQALESSLRDASKKIAVAEALRRADVARAAGAFHSARRFLAQLDCDGELLARACLLRAVVECEARDLRIESQVEIVTSDSVERELRRAQQADPLYFESWKDSFRESRPGKAVALLLQGLPKDQGTCDDPELGALYSRRAARWGALARQLEQAASRLSSHQEPHDSAFAKIGQALEDLFLAEFAPPPSHEAWELLAVMTGEEALRYG